MRHAILFALFFSLLGSSPGAHAATYYVRAGGSDRADGLSAKTAFHTVLRAAQALNHGDSIVIGPGVYNDTVLIGERFGTPDAPLSIVGDERGALTGDRAGPVVWESNEPGVAALRVYRSRDVVISGFTFRGVGAGVSVERVRGVRLERCTFDRLAKAINVSDCEDTRIESSVVTRCTLGIQVTNSTRTRLAHVTIASNSAAGLLVSSSAIGSVRNSLFVDNSTAMVADNASAPSWSSDYNTIAGTIGSWGSCKLCRTPYEWFSMSGQERHSNYVAPAFVNPAAYDLHIDPTVSWGGGLPGMAAGIALDPPVLLDRDGDPLAAPGGRIGTGAYAYPQASPGQGWKKLAVSVPKDCVRLSAAIYARDGNLLRTLVSDAAGVHDLWWDGRDDTGATVPVGAYEVRIGAGDIRLLDDGEVGDNGNPLGTYNPDNAQRVVPFADGTFVVSTIYDEAGIPLRYYAATGQPENGAPLTGSPWAIAAEGSGKDLIAGIDSELQRIIAPGERGKMPSGTESYPILAEGETLAKTADGKVDQTFGGVAVAGSRVLVTVPLVGGSIIRVIDMATGSKVADWPIPLAGDIKVDAHGNAWVMCDKEADCVNTEGKIVARHAVPVSGSYLAVGPTQLVVTSVSANKIVVLNLADGAIIRTLGKEHEIGKWQPDADDLFGDLRDSAFLPNGQLVVCEHGAVIAIDLQTGQKTMSGVSNFLDTLVPHPADSSIFYCYGANVIRLDHMTGAWANVRVAPDLVAPNLTLAQCVTTGIVDGKPYLLVNVNDSTKPTDAEKDSYIPSRYAFLDISDPLNPRFAGTWRCAYPLSYTDVRFDKEGNLCYPTYGKMQVTVQPFLGKDKDGYLQYYPIRSNTPPNQILMKSEPLQYRGAGQDALPRGMFHKGGMTIDTRMDDTYFLACTPLHNKMLPAWGASGTGVGKMSAAGVPLWYTESSTGNYTSISSVVAGKNLWVMAGKDTQGGAIDLYTADGLRVGTGQAGWSADWTNGMVDIREGLQAYLRPDGKPGATVEDDSIGRFIRYRVDGADTFAETISPLVWAGGALSGANPSPQEVAGNAIRTVLKAPRVVSLPVDGDWEHWADAGITPQIVSLPIAGWSRVDTSGLMQTFAAGTSIGAVAHDGQNVYVYFVTTDDSPHFDATNPGVMWMFDSVELWIEEEQFGLGFTKDGQPALFKYRYHNRAGAEWSANYGLPKEDVWGAKLDNIDSNTLGRLLEKAVGTSLDGKPGYALMAKIPMDEIKLVGGIAGREGGKILPMTGQPGEVIRIGVNFGKITAWGHEQDYKIPWPTGIMFSDPTTSIPFALGE